MQTCGIIAEYNPFHSGHAYQLAQAKKQTACDFLIVVMSGDFVQRGAPALLDKYTRARMALAAGADLVLMLPVYASTASAEGFARAGIGALHTTGVTDRISFGCENPAICAPEYQSLAHLLEAEHMQAALKTALTRHISAGLPYAQARVTAILDCFGSASDLSLLEEPNNLLAFEYLRAIAHTHAALMPCPIQRRGSYHDTSADGQTNTHAFLSASACRRLLLTVSDPSAALAELKNSAQLTPATADLLCSYAARFALLCEADFSQMLHYTLLAQKQQGFSSYLDCSDDLSARIANHLPQYEQFSQFCDVLKNKSLTRARIARALTHILLKLPAQMPAPLVDVNGHLPYLRVLGFRSSAAELLHRIKKQGSAPLITRPAQADKLLSAKQKLYFSQDLYASEIYRSALLHKCGCCYPDDHLRKIEIWNAG